MKLDRTLKCSHLKHEMEIKDQAERGYAYIRKGKVVGQIFRSTLRNRKTFLLVFAGGQKMTGGKQRRMEPLTSNMTP